MAALGAQVALEHALGQKDASVKEAITKFLDDHPEQVEACLVMLQQGCCDPSNGAKPDGDLIIPDSNTTLDHLASKVFVPAIHRMRPTLFTKLLLPKLKKGRKQLKHVFLFLVQEVPSSPIPTHSVEDLISVYADRYAQLGMRGQYLQIADGGVIDWGSSGTFKPTLPSSSPMSLASRCP